MGVTTTAHRDFLVTLYDRAVDGASPVEPTADAVAALPIERGARVLLLSFGKAAHAMAASAIGPLLRGGHHITAGLVVAPDDGPSPYAMVEVIRGDHPAPGRGSFDAGARIADLIAGRRSTDVAIVLVSGGASSLIAAPLRGQNELDLTRLHEQLLSAGLPIAEMNAVRRRFSRWGGGRLALALSPGKTHCLMISDVPGDEKASIGSGPCVADPSTIADVIAILKRSGIHDRLSQTHRDYLTSVSRGGTPETPKQGHPAFAHVTARVIVTNRHALTAAAAAAVSTGLSAEISAELLTGDAAAAGERVARELVAMRAAGVTGRCVMWGGETTVALGSGAGVGGRCQELALAAARALHDAGESGRGITILAAGTDGRDGPTDAAGAVVDQDVWRAAAIGGVDPAGALARHDSHAALAAAGALIPRRTTGTNVMDVVLGAIH